MATINEDYVSYETARLLKEKGFDEETDYIFYHYEEDNDWCFEKFLLGDKFDNKKMLHCPTHQMACKWLREIHNISITIYPDKEKGYEAVLYDTKDNVEIILQSFGIYGIHIFGDSYEEAVEAALKYTLKNLI